MVFSPDLLAAEFLELASEQRLNIIRNLQETNYTISAMAKKLDATVPEIHRNFMRLNKTGLVNKNIDGTYSLTLFGQVIYQHLPLFGFFLENKKYFADHHFGEIPIKFVHRIGELSESKMVNGYVRVLEMGSKIYKNAEKYIYNILVDVPYSHDIVKTLIQKLENRVEIRSIFSESAIVSEDRGEAIKENNFKKFITDETLKRKMKKDIKTVVILNEMEAAVCFPSSKNEPDLSKAFYSNDPVFHEWCYDYFNYFWRNSGAFQESKLNL